MLMMLIACMGLACMGPRDGTAVGNPGNAGLIGQSEDGSRVHWDRATVRAKAAAAENEEGVLGSFLGQDLNLLRPSGAFIELQRGRYEGVFLYIDALEMRGETDSGVPVILEVEPSRLCVEGDFRVQEDDALLLLLPLDRIVDVDAVDEAGLDRLYVGPETSEGVQLAMDLETLPELWRDVDRDGYVGPGDRLIQTNRAR